MDQRASISGGRGGTDRLKVTVYSPEAMLLDPRRMVREMVKDLRDARGLARSLALRDIKSQYRASMLGYLWAFITPLVNTALWVFLSLSGVVKVANTGIPYPAYVFSGTMIWQMFTESLNSPMNQINSGRSMLSKLSFPREALIMSGFYKVLFSASIKTLILIPALLVMGVVPDAHLLLFPVAVLTLIITGLSVGLFLAPMGTLYSDIGRLLPMVTQFLMYLSPVVFAIPAEGTMARLFRMNPLTPLVHTARSWLTGTESLMLPQFGMVAGAVLVLLLVGWFLFRIAMPVLIERMSS